MLHNRTVRGFVWGVIATIVMSIIMILGAISGMSPIPEPIPKAIVVTLLGKGLPQPILMALTIGSHLAYGGVPGALLARYTRPVTIAKGLGLGVVLWLFMQIIVLPFLGWGFFGTAITPKIAVATLVLHLIYGGTLGWLMDRNK